MGLYIVTLCAVRNAVPTTMGHQSGWVSPIRSRTKSWVSQCWVLMTRRVTWWGNAHAFPRIY